MITRLVEYISACPQLEGKQLKVNYLDKEIGSASLEMTQDQKRVRSYADGGSLEQKVFVLALREGFGMGDSENQRIIEKCQMIEEWLEKWAEDGQNSGLKEDGTVVFVNVLKPFRTIRTEGSFARYEAEIEIIYLKK